MKIEIVSLALIKFLKSKVFSKKTKRRLNTVIIRFTSAYWCEIWTINSIIERKPKTFKSKIWIAVCEPVYDDEKKTWRRYSIKELQEQL
jgi:hypothetical protein